jgi:hypothetical protein
MGVSPGGGGAASAVEIICKLGTLHHMGLQKLGNTHYGNEDGEVGVQLQIYANVKEDGMVII